MLGKRDAQKTRSQRRRTGVVHVEPVEPLKNNRIPTDFYEIVGRSQHPRVSILGREIASSCGRGDRDPHLPSRPSTSTTRQRRILTASNYFRRENGVLLQASRNWSTSLSRIRRDARARASRSMEAKSNENRTSHVCARTSARC